MKFYIQTGGGAGDMIKHYFWGHLGWQYIETIKEKYPEAKIKLFTMCCNMSSQNLFDNIKEIDEFQHLPWMGPSDPWKEKDKYTKGYKPLNKVQKLLNITLKSRKPKNIPLTQEEENFIISKNLGNEYIAMHPFAGDGIRRHLTLEQYFRLAKKLINETGHNIVILGGSSKRIIGKTSRNIKEEFPFKHEKIINLVNKTNLRTSIEITRRAKYFVGNNSCFFCVRLAQGTKFKVFSTKQSANNFMNIKLENKRVK